MNHKCHGPWHGDCLNTASSAGISGTSTYLRDIPGKNGMVGSYAVVLTKTGQPVLLRQPLLRVAVWRPSICACA